MITPDITGTDVSAKTDSVCADEDPHPLLAVTVIFPLLLPAVTVIEFVVELPDHPWGIVHVYDVAPFTGLIKYVLVVERQIFVSPLIIPGVMGIVFTEIASVLTADEPHPLFAITVILPAEVPAVAVIEFVADDPVHPVGNDHVYEVAPLTAAILYVFELPAQTVVFPFIVPGVDGFEFTVTAKDWVADEPQLLLADTVMFPPELPEVTEIELVVEDPDQPDGRVHVYEVAPLITPML
jgi:hypothetical protein